MYRCVENLIVGVISYPSELPQIGCRQENLFLAALPGFMRLSGNFWLVFLQINIFAYLCIMKPEQLLRAILPDVLIDNFDIVSFDKSADRFDIYLDEKKVQLKEDKYNPEIIAYGFGEYRVIQDYPIRGRATYLHVRKRKWLDKSSNEIFSYDWDLSEFDGTRLNSEFVSFLKEGD